MRIFITNDDGLEAKGIKTLIKEVSKIAEICVIAPDRERSAISQSLTFFEPLRLNKVEEKEGYEIYKSTGTPTDCVFLGIKHVLKDKKPDLVISGINHGANIGDDINYSGTVAAAKEAAIHGIPSFAISLNKIGPGGDFSFAGKFAAKLAQKLDKYKLPKRMFLNVNVPYIPEEEIGGTALTVQGKSLYKSWIEEHMDPRKRPMYWINSEPPSGSTDRNTDFLALKEKKVSITPIRLDLTDHDFLNNEKDNWIDF